MDEALVEKAANAIAPELMKVEAVMTDPMSLNRMMARRAARAALSAIIHLIEAAAFERAAELMEDHRDWCKPFGEDRNWRFADDFSTEAAAAIRSLTEKQNGAA